MTREMAPILQQESPDASTLSPMDRVPRRRTPARMRTYFLRQFERSGSLMEAAARAGITPRTVQRWRNRDRCCKQRGQDALGDAPGLRGHGAAMIVPDA